LKWQVLSWKVMLEPNAALTISNALNLKNEVAMQVGQNEIFALMHRLCNPAPEKTLWDPIRDDLIQLYPQQGQDPNLVYTFQYIMESGGRGSIHLDDYNDFQELFVDPHKRKLPVSAYKTVLQIPQEYARFRLAILCYAWKKDPVKGWCPPPPDLSWRFNAESKHVSWIPFLQQLEQALVHIRFCVVGNTPVGSLDASAVAEKRGTVVGTKKDRTKFMTECNSSIIASLLSAPTLRKKAEQERQLNELQDQLAKLIAKKLRDFYQRHWEDCAAVGDTLKSVMPVYQSVIDPEKNR